VVIMASGIALGRVCTTAAGGVSRGGDHTPPNKLTETCSLGL